MSPAGEKMKKWAIKSFEDWPWLYPVIHKLTSSPPKTFQTSDMLLFYQKYYKNFQPPLRSLTLPTPPVKDLRGNKGVCGFLFGWKPTASCCVLWLILHISTTKTPHLNNIHMKQIHPRQNVGDSIQISKCFLLKPITAQIHFHPSPTYFIFNITSMQKFMWSLK